jgi:hypothetical protein
MTSNRSFGVTDEQRDTLNKRVVAHNTQQVVLRLQDRKIVLGVAAGWSVTATAKRLATTTVRFWRDRFAADGPDTLRRILT